MTVELYNNVMHLLWKVANNKTLAREKEDRYIFASISISTPSESFCDFVPNQIDYIFMPLILTYSFQWMSLNLLRYK